MAAPNIDDAYVCPGEGGGEGGEVVVRPKKRLRLYLFNPSGTWLYWWLVVITVAVLYNAFFIIVRETFDPLQDDYLPLWLTLDYLADSIYIVDMVVQFFTSELCGRSRVYQYWEERGVPVLGGAGCTGIGRSRVYRYWEEQGVPVLGGAGCTSIGSGIASYTGCW